MLCTLFILGILVFRVERFVCWFGIVCGCLFACWNWRLVTLVGFVGLFGFIWWFYWWVLF